MEELSPTDAQRMLTDQKSGQAVLLDVREDMELEMASIADVLHIPMGQIPERLAEIDRNQAVIVMCHSGGRSAQVAQYLNSQGFPKVYNLSGGILAWAEDVDPSIPQY